MQSPLTRLFELLYPPRCAACRKTGAWLCDECLALCNEHHPPCCLRCGAHTGGHGHDCAARLCHLQGLHARYWYQGPVRDLVHAFKYDNMHAAADWMAGRMPVDRLPANAAFVPVPLHALREKERGYNQSALLARALGRRTGLPVLPVLRRVRDTSPQAHQDAVGRWTNVDGAFVPIPRRTLEGTVVLVDDVCTTGATLEQCARVVTEMGAGAVLALVFART